MHSCACARARRGRPPGHARSTARSQTACARAARGGARTRSPARPRRGARLGAGTGSGLHTRCAARVAAQQVRMRRAQMQAQWCHTPRLGPASTGCLEVVSCMWRDAGKAGCRAMGRRRLRRERGPQPGVQNRRRAGAPGRGAWPRRPSTRAARARPSLQRPQAPRPPRRALAAPHRPSSKARRQPRPSSPPQRRLRWAAGRGPRPRARPATSLLLDRLQRLLGRSSYRTPHPHPSPLAAAGPCPQLRPQPRRRRGPCSHPRRSHWRVRTGAAPRMPDRAARRGAARSARRAPRHRAPRLPRRRRRCWRATRRARGRGPCAATCTAAPAGVQRDRGAHAGVHARPCTPQACAHGAGSLMSRQSAPSGLAPATGAGLTSSPA